MSEPELREVRRWGGGGARAGETAGKRPGKQVACGIGVHAMREWKVPRRD